MLIGQVTSLTTLKRIFAMISKEKLNLIASGASATDDLVVFGTPCTLEEAELVLYPVPWEATTSYGAGTSKGPSSIKEASQQLDLEDLCFDRPYQAGLFLKNESDKIQELNEEVSSLVHSIRNSRDAGSDSVASEVARVNVASARINTIVYDEVGLLLDVTRELLQE